MRSLDRNMIMKFLAGQASPEEAEQIDAWLKSSSRNKEHFNQLWQLWNAAGEGVAYKKPDIGQAWAQFRTHIDSPAPKSTHHTGATKIAAAGKTTLAIKLLTITAGLIITAALVVHHLNKPDPTPAAASAQAAGRILNTGDSIVRDTVDKNVVITLDRQTVIQQDAGFRGITLLRGSAYLQDADTQTSLVINAGGHTIRSSGASCLLVLDSTTSTLAIQLFSGAIDLSGKDSTLHLAGSRRILYDLRDDRLAGKDTGPATIKNIPDSNEIAFSTGIYTFRNTSLAGITAVLAKAYKMNIRLKNPAIGHCRMTAQFDNLPVNQIMDIIAATLGLTYTNGDDNKTILIDGHGCD